MQTHTAGAGVGCTFDPMGWPRMQPARTPTRAPCMHPPYPRTCACLMSAYSWRREGCTASSVGPAVLHASSMTSVMRSCTGAPCLGYIWTTNMTAEGRRRGGGRGRVSVTLRLVDRPLAPAARGSAGQLACSLQAACHVLQCTAPLCPTPHCPALPRTKPHRPPPTHSAAAAPAPGGKTSCPAPRQRPRLQWAAGAHWAGRPPALCAPRPADFGTAGCVYVGEGPGGGGADVRGLGS